MLCVAVSRSGWLLLLTKRSFAPPRNLPTVLSTLR